MSNQVKEIPLFPLNIFLLPGEQLPLHIFEPRYQELFEDAKNGLAFGLPFTSETNETTFVSICKLLRVTKEYEGGESDVVIECNTICKLLDFKSPYTERTYPGGIVDTSLNFIHDESISEELMHMFKEYIRLKYGGSPSDRQLAHYRLQDLAASVAMSNEDKIRFLMAEKKQVREGILANVMKYLCLLMKQEQGIENGLILN